MNAADDRDIYSLRFPAGEFVRPEKADEESLAGWIKILEAFPSELRKTVEELGEENLGRRYRPGGWTGKQVIHHCADSHSNALIRFKLALTEDTPVLKPYLEAKWAKLADTKDAPVELSIKLLEALHAKMAILLRSLNAEDLRRTYIHPEHEGVLTLADCIALYAWHCRHHLAHLKLLNTGEASSHR